MKISRIIKVIAVALCCAIVTVATVPTIAKPVTAEASWHWDFWNDYEDGCTVVYNRVSSLGAYKVVVMSEDCHRIWTNDDPNVYYWYTSQQLRTMIGEEPVQTGYKICDVRLDLLNDTNYFRRYSA